MVNTTEKKPLLSNEETKLVPKWQWLARFFDRGWLPNLVVNLLIVSSMVKSWRFLSFSSSRLIDYMITNFDAVDAQIKLMNKSQFDALPVMDKITTEPSNFLKAALGDRSDQIFDTIKNLCKNNNSNYQTTIFLFNASAYFYYNATNAGFNNKREENVKDTYKCYKLFGAMVNYIYNGSAEIDKIAKDSSNQDPMAIFCAIKNVSENIKSSMNTAKAMKQINYLSLWPTDFINEIATGKECENPILLNIANNSGDNDKYKKSVEKVTSDKSNVYWDILKSKFNTLTKNALAFGFTSLDKTLNKLPFLPRISMKIYKKQLYPIGIISSANWYHERNNQVSARNRVLKQNSVSDRTIRV